MKNTLNNFFKFKEFIGEDTFKALTGSVAIGVLWFLIESSFVLVLQSFLLSIGILPKEKSFLPDWYPDGLHWSLTLLVLFGLVRATIYFLRAHFSNLTQVSFITHQRKNIVSFALDNSNQISNKEIMSTFSEFTTQSGYALFYSSMLVTAIVSSFFLLCLGLYLAPIEMMIGLAILMLLAVPLKFQSRVIDKLGKKVAHQWEGINEILISGIKNAFLLKVYKKEKFETQRCQNEIETYKATYVKYSLSSSFGVSLPMFVGLLTLSFITFLSVSVIKTNPAKLLSFFYVFIRLAQAASEINSTYSMIKLNMPGTFKLYDLFKRFKISERSLQLDNRKLFNKQSDVSVSVRDLSVEYSSRLIFSKLSFELKKGDILLIKGKSGAGKSTLLSTILGINQNYSGEVLICDRSLRDYKLSIEDQIAYVGPEAYLLPGTVKENLIYGNNKAHSLTDAEIWQALKEVDLYNHFKATEGGLSSFLHDVTTLSTGQRQRLSIARALLRSPELIIFDEATANVDKVTEEEIYANLIKKKDRQILIAVTHKDNLDYIATQKIELMENKLGTY